MYTLLTWVWTSYLHTLTIGSTYHQFVSVTARSKPPASPIKAGPTAPPRKKS